jgi:hypothetical protein
MTAALPCSARWSAPVLAALLLAGCSTPPQPQGLNRCVERKDASRCITRPPRALALLPPGAPVSVQVDARCEWNPTGVILERGARYRVKVTQGEESWVDGVQRASDLQTGWPGFYARFGRIAQRWARAPDVPMYSLIGAQGHESRNFFVVGRETEFTASTGEELLFFANDWPGRYHNNRGCLDVEIQRQ